MLDQLSEHGMKATFFVAAGGRTGARFLFRSIRRGYWRRYQQLGLWRIITRMAVPAIRSFGNRLVQSKDVLSRIVADGHELGLHGYYEGLMRRDLFRLFLQECRHHELQTLTLKEMSQSISASGMQLPTCRLTRGPLPGFVGDVSRQEAQPHDA
jgi:peptidoglycan/xylan/chitin deacetylase (PgdA/CDA1 family)